MRRSVRRGDHGTGRRSYIAELMGYLRKDVCRSLCRISLEHAE